MAITFTIPKEHRAAVGGFTKITVPDKYHGAASKRMSDQFGFPLDTVEGWTAGKGNGTPINSALQSLRHAATVGAGWYPGMGDAPKPAVTQTITEAAGITSQKAADVADRIRRHQNEMQEKAKRDAEKAQQAADLEAYYIQQAKRKEQMKREAAAAGPDAVMGDMGSDFTAAGLDAARANFEAAQNFDPSTGRGASFTPDTEGYGTEYMALQPSTVGEFSGPFATNWSTGEDDFGTGRNSLGQGTGLGSGVQSFTLEGQTDAAVQQKNADLAAADTSGSLSGGVLNNSFSSPEALERGAEDTERIYNQGIQTGGGQSDGILDDPRYRNVDQIIAMFPETGGKFGPPTFNEDGIEVINPLLAELITSADSQGGFISAEAIATAYADSAEAVAKYNKDADVAKWAAQGKSDEAIAKLELDNTNAREDQRLAAEQYVADQKLAADKYVAAEQRRAAKSTAYEARLGQTAAARSQADAIEAAAESARSGQEAAAAFQAGAASPFGFMQQATINEADQTPQEQLASIYEQLNQVGLAQAGGASPFGFMNQAVARENALGEVGAVTPQEQLEAIYGQLNEVGLAQAAAANLAAQDNAFSFAAGAGQARNPLTGELDFNADQVAKIAANTPAGLAAQGQEAAARAGATGFGALLSGDQAQQANANAILRAQAANNPYAIQQLGRGWSDTTAANQNLRIDQILRGGLTPEQRLNEIAASQSGQNFANQLNFMGNPSAVGFATERGLLGGGDNQILQDINNSSEGNIPGSLFGFNSPSAAGAGGGQTTGEPYLPRPTMNTLRNASDEQIGFLQGAAAAGGQTPSEFQAGIESVTPQGY